MPEVRDSLLAKLRAATEDDVARALDGAYIAPPLSKPDELLEFFNRMVDVLGRKMDGDR